MAMKTVGRIEFYDFIRINQLRVGDTDVINDEPLETRKCWHRFEAGKLQDRPAAMLDKERGGFRVTYWIDADV